MSSTPYDDVFRTLLTDITELPEETVAKPAEKI